MRRGGPPPQAGFRSLRRAVSENDRSHGEGIEPSPRSPSSRAQAGLRPVIAWNRNCPSKRVDYAGGYLRFHGKQRLPGVAGRALRCEISLAARDSSRWTGVYTASVVRLFGIWSSIQLARVVPLVEHPNHLRHALHRLRSRVPRPRASRRRCGCTCPVGRGRTTRTRSRSKSPTKPWRGEAPARAKTKAGPDSVGPAGTDSRTIFLSACHLWAPRDGQAEKLRGGHRGHGPAGQVVPRRPSRARPEVAQGP